MNFLTLKPCITGILFCPLHSGTDNRTVNRCLYIGTDLILSKESHNANLFSCFVKG